MVLEKIQKAIVSTLRSSGQALDVVGRTLETNSYVEKLIPSTRSVKFGNDLPKINNSFIAQSASVIGKVEIGSGSSVWYGAVVRGDVNTIKIGNNVTIGDRAMIHCSGTIGNSPTVIGNNVIVGAGAIIHGSTLEDESFVGNGAQVLDGAKVCKHGIVSAGSVVGQGKVVASGQLWGGCPAVYIRDLTAGEISSISSTATENLELATLHAEESAKTWQQIEEDEYIYEQTVYRNPHYYKRLTKEQVAHKLGEHENHLIPGRVLDARVSARTMKDERQYEPAKI